MRHLLALLNDGTRGTQVEPSQITRGVHGKDASVQSLSAIGTLVTRGTLQNERDEIHDRFAQRITDLADAWHERLAICLAAGDVSEVEARRTAEAEVGAAFVRTFILREVTP